MRVKLLGFLNRSFKNMEDSVALVLLVSSVELGSIRECLFVCFDPVSVLHACTTPPPQQEEVHSLDVFARRAFTRAAL